jgi:hypothetical protein
MKKYIFPHAYIYVIGKKVCMACREAKKHRKRLINERKQEKSPAHFNQKWCAG